jgi:hypothetical protein
MAIPYVYKSASKKIKPVGDFKLQRGTLVADPFADNKVQIDDNDAEVVQDSNKPDLIIFNDNNTGELLFKIDGDMNIKFGPSIKAPDDIRASVATGLRDYLPQSIQEGLKTKIALHYCYAAMKAAQEASKTKEKPKDAAKLWEKAMRKAEECFY